MTAYGVEDLVVLALDPAGIVGERAPRGAATTVELSETIAFGESMADRVQLLSALSSLTSAGLVEESIDEAGDRDGERSRYRLTDEGRARASSLRESLADERVTVTDGTDDVECRLCDVPAEVGLSIAEALVRRSPSGELVLEESFEDIVDRTAAFDRLEACFDAVRETGARTVVVSGDAGVGKTTFVDAVLDRVRGRCAAVFVGRSRPGGDVPFAPVKTALETSDPSTTLPFDTDLGIETPDAEAYRARRTSLYTDVHAWLVARAVDGPVVLVVEDLQWADSATLDLLSHLASSIGDAPILLLCTYRVDGVDDTDPISRRCPQKADAPMALPLEPFDRDTTATLVETELRQRGVPSDFTDAIYEGTGGNALFVVETVAAALEDGSLDPRIDRYPTNTAALSVPSVVDTTIRRRFDRLDQETSGIVNVGAVADEPITVETLRALCSLSPPRLHDRIDLLVDAGVWQPTDGGYRFRSDVLRSGAQSAMDPAHRRDLHRRVAAQLADDTEPNHARVADHFERADDLADALAHYRLAAEDAEATYAHDVAVSHYDRALSIARELDREDAVLELLESLGDSYYTRGEFDEADRHFRYVREAADDPDRIRRSFYYQARMHFEQSEFEQTKTYARRGLDVGDDEITEEVCWLVDYLGSAHMKCGEHDEAVEHFETQRSYAESIDFTLSLGRSYQNLGNTSRRMGSIDEAVEYGERAVELLEAASTERELARCLNDVALIHRSAGRSDRYVDTLERCHELAERTGNVRARILAKHNLGVAVQSEGDWAAARTYYADVTELAELAGDTDSTAISLWNVSVIDLATGDVPAAIDGFERALELVSDSEEVEQRAHFHTHLGRAYLLSERFVEARWHVAMGQRLAAEHELTLLQGTSALNAGALARERGDLEIAFDHLKAARSALQDVDDVRTQCFLLEQRARTHAAADEASTALELARRAHDLAPDGNPQETIRVDVTLGSALRTAGTFEDARERLASALADALDLSVESAIRAHRELARLERETGDPARACEHYEAGTELAESAGMTLYVTRLSDELASLDLADESVDRR